MGPGGSPPVGFRKVGNRVELRGTAGGGHEPIMFTLPEGYRPDCETPFPVASGRGLSIVTISDNGDVLADPNDKWVRLDGISFETDAPDNTDWHPVVH